MAQLVGSACALCNQRIGSIVEGDFCLDCGSPVHFDCVKGQTSQAGHCLGCGAPTTVAPASQPTRTPSAPRDPTGLQNAGIVVFVVFCAIPALEMNGFGFDVPFSLPTALACATIGGAIGGLLICPRPILAGLTGGLLAGPVGLLAVYYYTEHRQRLWSIELLIVQGIACLPGLSIGLLLKKALSTRS
jgi:hypothetical protein